MSETHVEMCVCSREKASFMNTPSVNLSNRVVAEHKQASELHNGNGEILNFLPTHCRDQSVARFFRLSVGIRPSSSCFRLRILKPVKVGMTCAQSARGSSVIGASAVSTGVDT
jgi:hypothetical protein